MDILRLVIKKGITKVDPVPVYIKASMCYIILFFQYVFKHSYDFLSQFINRIVQKVFFYILAYKYENFYET